MLTDRGHGYDGRVVTGEIDVLNSTHSGSTVTKAPTMAVAVYAVEATVSMNSLG